MKKQYKLAGLVIMFLMIAVYSIAAAAPPADKPFLDYDFIGDGYGFVSTHPSEEPWVPDVSIDPAKIIWVSPEGGGDGSSEDTPTTMEQAIGNTEEGYSIIALDGDYSFEIIVPKLIHVNLISKNKYGAKIHPLGDNGDDAAFRFTNKAEVQYVNFIGFEVLGGRSFIFNPGTAIESKVHHIYFSDIKFHDIFLAIYSGLHSHDWTVDRCMFYDSRGSYLWYIMGFHQTVMNTIMYNDTYLSLAIRGHYPLDEFYNWQGGNPFVKNRDHPFLDPDDWTHKIINNTFGTTYNTDRPTRGQLGLFYDIIAEEEEQGDGEACYLPPQNVVVANNVFIDQGSQHKVGFDIWANRGINTGAIDAVNGILITHNVTAKNELVVGGPGTNVNGIKNDDENTLKSDSINFIDETGREYHLTPHSTDLIDKGSIEVYTPNNDFAGRQRDEKPDVGAYEYDESINAIEYRGSAINPIEIFPNPCADYFFVSIPDPGKGYTFRLFNEQMQQVKSININKYSESFKKVNTASLSRGVYYCVLSSENKQLASGKVVLIGN